MSDIREHLQKHGHLRYDEDLSQVISPSTRQVLENYSKIPPAEVEPHIYAVRDKAFAIHPYPCIGEGRFLQLAIGSHKLYPEILSRMKKDGATLLDLGCAFAQDLRRLVADGVDGRQCYGSDLRLDLIDLGYELFRDRETLHSKFIAADVFDAESPLTQLYGKIDVINASSFFHLFTRDEQLQIARQCVKLLRPQANSLIVGRHRAQVVAGDTTGKFGPSAKFWHSAESWEQFWTEIGNEMHVEFDVNVTMTGAKFERLELAPKPGEDVSMSFSVRRR